VQLLGDDEAKVCCLSLLRESQIKKEVALFVVLDGRVPGDEFSSVDRRKCSEIVSS